MYVETELLASDDENCFDGCSVQVAPMGALDALFLEFMYFM